MSETSLEPEAAALSARFAAAGTSFFGYDSGPGHETTLLLLHGNGGSSTAFVATGLFQQLARSSRVVAFDARGFGATPGAGGALSYLAMADDAIDVMDALGMTTCIPVGFSMGGGTAQAMAVRHPHRVAALVSAAMGRLDTLHTDPHPMPQLFTDLLSGARRPDGSTLRELAELGFSTTTIRERPELVELAAERLAGHDWVAAAASGWAEDEYALVSPDAIRVPVLAVAGAEDKMIDPQRVRRLADSVPDGTYVEIPDAGHGLAVEQPDGLTSVIAEFVLRRAAESIRGRSTAGESLGGAGPATFS